MGVQNKQIDLDNHLFAELERLGDEGLTGDALMAEVNRAKAIARVAQQVNASRANSLKAAIFMDQAYDSHACLPEGF